MLSIVLYFLQCKKKVRLLDLLSEFYELVSVMLGVNSRRRTKAHFYIKLHRLASCLVCEDLSNQSHKFPIALKMFSLKMFVLWTNRRGVVN